MGKYTKYLIVVLLFCQGCFFCGSFGKELDVDEIIVRKYKSEVEIPPEIPILFAGEEMAGASFNSYQLSKWSLAVRARDNYICFMCGKEFLGSGEIESHHIMPKSLYPEIAYCMWNGITLCDACHLIVHKSKINHKKYAPMFLIYTLQFEGALP